MKLLLILLAILALMLVSAAIGYCVGHFLGWADGMDESDASVDRDGG